jgi:hypothetical protein
MRDPYGEPVLTLVIVEQRLGAAFAFIVTAARARQINVTAVLLGLRMDVGIAVYLAGGRLQNARVQALGETQHVDRTNHARLRRLNRIMLIVDRRGRAGEIVDLVDIDIERKGHVVAHDLEGRLAEQWFDVAARTCEIVVDAENLALLLEQSCAQMRAQKARTTRHKDPLFHRTPPGCYRDKISCRS